MAVFELGNHRRLKSIIPRIDPAYGAAMQYAIFDGRMPSKWPKGTILEKVALLGAHHGKLMKEWVLATYGTYDGLRDEIPIVPPVKIKVFTVDGKVYLHDQLLEEWQRNQSGST